MDSSNSSSEDSIVIYRATVNYTSATNAEELSYQKEDILEVYVPKTAATGTTLLASSTGGWYKASNTRTKKNGYVQLQNLQRCNDSSTSSNSNSMTSPSASHYLSVTGMVGDTSSAGNGSSNVATNSSSGSNGSNGGNSNTTNSGDPSGTIDGASTVAAVTTVVSTMANLTITKSSKDSNTLVVNMTPTVGHQHHGGGGDPYALEDIYVPCVNPSTGAGLETHN